MPDFTLLAGNWAQENTQITLVVNEFMAKNNNFIPDEYGNYDDWIEIYNYGDEAIDIAGMYLADDIDVPLSWWQIPYGSPEITTIAPGGYMLIWADNTPMQGPLHVNFALAAGGGEDVGLISEEGVLIDAIEFFFPQQSDTSYGRYPDANDNWQFFVNPTPGKPNKLEDIGIYINEIMYHSYHSTSGTIEPENLREEYIELFNNGNELVNFSGWRFSDGVDFAFPNDVTIGVGQYLVVAADVNTFTAKYPGVTNVIGGWDGRLSNSGEAIRLIDAMDIMIDRVRYADQGEWGTRELGPQEYGGHRGWIWASEHDGGGKSLELINPELSNKYAQNWAASLNTGGTPGAINSVASGNIAPMIQDVKHRPRIPGPNDTVTVTADIIDEMTIGLTVTLHYRVDVSVYQGVDIYPNYNPADYNKLTMYDDGAHDDDDPGDGEYGAQIPAQPDGTIIEFFIEARDAGFYFRTWPPPSFIDGSPEQVTNALYHVDDSFDPEADWDPGSQPIYYLIMTGMEWGRLEYIGTHSSSNGPDSQMNTTLISVDGVDKKTRYNLGVRNRGHGSRNNPPNNYRVNIPHDRSWKDVTAINLNTKYTYLQIVGNTIFRMSGLAQPVATAVQVRINGRNVLLDYPGDWNEHYGSYVHIEVVDNDFVGKHYPDNDDGNAYKCMRITRQADLRYEGSDPDPYRQNYFKRTNTAEDDWSDLIELTDVLSNTPDAIYVQEVNRVLKVEQWIRFIAINTVMNNVETTLASGNGDDYYLYRGIADPRFVLIQHDLDSIFGLGQGTGSATNGIFDAAAVPALNRLLTHPQFVPRYYWHLKDLIETTFSFERFRPFLGELLGDFVPVAKINQIKNFVQARNAHVLSLIPQEFTIASDLLQNSGYYRTTGSVATLNNVNGTANAIETRSVRVNGQPADWSPIYGNLNNGQCKWSIAGGTDITLNPGINRIIVQTFDGPNGTGKELECGYIDIWYDDGNVTDIFGTLTADTTLDAASGPWNVTGDVVVNAGKTLTIEPGTTLFFDSGVSIIVNGGRLLAEGTEYELIRFTRTPNTGPIWDGLQFANTMQDNRITYAVVEYGRTLDGMVGLDQSNLLLDHVTLDQTDRRRISTLDSSLIVRNSIFTNIFDFGQAPTGDNICEHIWGAAPTTGHFIIEKNVFGTITGHNDAIDVDGNTRPAPVIQILNNVFLGGGDDALDLEGDAHIEGNVFMHYHKDQFNTGSGNANVISAGGGYEYVVVSNVFYDMDHVAQIKSDSFMTFVNNTVVDANISALYFLRPTSTTDYGRGAYVDGSIFWNTELVFDRFTGTTDLTINQSIVSSDWHSYGVGNIDADPIFVDPNVDFHLKSMSPAIGTGPCNLDMGAYVPAGAAICGEPDEVTYHTDATLTVGGPGITHYKYSVNEPNGSWSQELSVAVPIDMNGLTDGNSYTVYAIGKNSAGVWQSQDNATTSRTWTVDTSYRHLVINEILAHSDGTDPDLIELYYDGPSLLILLGMGLTDDPCDPNKFVFSIDTVNSLIMFPGDYMVLYGDPNVNLKNHLGFALSNEGEGLYLYDKPSNGGELIDSVVFGSQINNFSIGRIGYGGIWKLNQPTFGQANIAQPLGDPAMLKINEWLANEEVLFKDDFIELYNPDPLPVPLSELYLTDNPVTEPYKQQVSPLSFVDGQGFVVFRVDDQNRPGHLDFRLNADGEIIALFDTELNEIDKVFYGPQTTDASQGRTPNGTDNIEFFVLPTPRVANPSVPTVTVTNLIDIDDVWSYEQSNTDLGTSWRAVGYDDTSWPTGAALLYVEYSALPAPKNTLLTLGPRTFYFRRHFTLDVDPNDVASFEYATVIDDGAVVYINGNEVLPRIGMEEGVDIYFNTFSERSVGNAVYEYHPPIPSEYFIKGDNVIAVEVHQTNATSPDIVFGLELDAVATTYDESLDDLLALLDGLRITELMYHDSVSSDYDFIELQNVGDVPLDLNDVSFTNGIEYTFPAITLDVGQYVVVVSNLASFVSRYGTAGINIAGEYTGNLSNGGENIVLKLPWPYEAAIMRFSYNDRWYPTTDGLGLVLEIIDPNAKPATWDDSESWQAAFPTPGNP
ncbi:MAG: hypothetical protein FVQ85_11300 [Planctomycetes bacterium]|nr:hypothetical protein [Planctomycetota bacterium]